MGGWRPDESGTERRIQMSVTFLSTFLSYPLFLTKWGGQQQLDIQPLYDVSNKCKVQFKNLCTKFWNCCCYLTMYQIFLTQIAFQGSDWVELDFGGFLIRISLNVKSQGKKSRFSPKGLTTPKIWDVKLCILLITNMKTFLVLLCQIKSYGWKKSAT